ncbi:MAG: hypothetical protein LQ337_001984 [Flavoplaca oasis]|nr:MAG: hypothetical protein LQ337_001984 [Flavoplaca oasis]
MNTPNDSQYADSAPGDHIDDSRNDGSASPKQRRVGYGGYHPLWRPLPYGGVVPRRQHSVQDNASSLGSTAPTQTENPHHQISADEDTELPAPYNERARRSVPRGSIRKHARPGSMESLDSRPPAKTSKSMPKQDSNCIERQAIQYNKKGKKNPPRETRLSSTAPTKRSAQEVDDLFHATEQQGARRSKRKLEKDAQKASGGRADALLALTNKRAARSTHPNTESSIIGTKVAKPAPAWDSAALRTIGNFRDKDGQAWVIWEGAWWPIR